MLYIPDFRVYQEAIDTAWNNKGKDLPIIFEDAIVVAIFIASDLELQYYVPIKGTSTFSHTDILYRKAEVVHWTGMRYTDALDYAEKDEIKLLGDWLPIGKGTNYQGAAPVYIAGELALIVAVSGQDHRAFDQPLADAIAEELEKELGK